MNESHPVVLFDGVCNLCNKSVQFIIRRDKKDQFRFAALQGKTGQEILARHGLPADSFNSFILAEGDKIYTRSTGALRMLRILGLPWSLFYVYIIPTPELRKKFLD